MGYSGTSGFAPSAGDPRQGLSPRQWQARVKERFRKGQTADQIVDELVRSGFPPREAQEIVGGARRSHVSDGLKLFIGGLALATPMALTTRKLGLPLTLAPTSRVGRG